MHSEIKENYREKLRLVVAGLLAELDEKIKAMHAEHAAKGLLRSGNTIKRTMIFISEANAQLYFATIEHLQKLCLPYDPDLEGEVQAIVKLAQDSYKREAITRFQKSTEMAGNPRLYERLLPEVEASMASDLAKFQNQLNAVVVTLKHNSKVSFLEKVGWSIEGVLLLASVFIAGMWYKDPAGNYEPILVALGLAIPLIALVIRRTTKK